MSKHTAPQPPKVALYGTIPAVGGQWNVYFRPAGDWVTHSLSGYGEFPREDYPHIPVIDYRSGTWYSSPYVAEAGFTGDGFTHHAPLAEVLRLHRERGITVIEPGQPVPSEAAPCLP